MLRSHVWMLCLLVAVASTFVQADNVEIVQLTTSGQSGHAGFSKSGPALGHRRLDAKRGYGRKMRATDSDQDYDYYSYHGFMSQPIQPDSSTHHGRIDPGNTLGGGVAGETDSAITQDTVGRAEPADFGKMTYSGAVSPGDILMNLDKEDSTYTSDGRRRAAGEDEGEETEGNKYLAHRRRRGSDNSFNNMPQCNQPLDCEFDPELQFAWCSAKNSEGWDYCDIAHFIAPEERPNPVEVGGNNIWANGQADPEALKAGSPTGGIEDDSLPGLGLASAFVEIAEALGGG